MPEIKDSFCRICEASCGLKIEVEDNKILSIAPNPDHIGTLGFSCMKGLHQDKMYDSPDRLTQPLKRIDGKLQPISWKQAFQEIGTKVSKLKAVSSQSIGMYVGTAAGFSLLHPIFAEGFMQGLGSRNIYSSATQDCANRFASAQAMYGFPFFQPYVDLDNVECMLIVGTNPVVSKWTFLQVAHPVKRLKEVKARGGRIVVVDPRFTETAKVAGEHQFIRPNTDVYFFLSFLHQVFAGGHINEAQVQKTMTGLEQLKQLASEWPPERTAETTGIEPEALRALVDQFCQVKGAAIVTGTGLGMGQQGTLGHWLAESIIAVTGNLDRRGGTLVGKGIFDFAEFARKKNMFNREARSRIGGFRELNGGFPGGILADEILTAGEEQIKAMFITGGNPLLTMANSERLKQAFEQLDLLVVTDIYLNETASLADYVLPATSPLERPDLPFVFPLFLGMQSIPYLTATEPVVKPSGEQLDESTIYAELASACDAPLFGSRLTQTVLRLIKRFNRNRVPQRLLLDLILRSNGQPSFKKLLGMPNGLSRSQSEPGTFLGTRPTTVDRMVHLAPEAFVQNAQSLDLPNAASADYPFRLITKRAHSTHNSWTQNITELTNGRHNSSNFVYVHSGDAETLGLAEDAVADIHTETAAIRLPVKHLDSLMPGTIAVPHGWGHQHAEGLSVANKLSGANVNILASDGPDQLEPLSGMANLTGIPVNIRPSAGELNTRSWSGI